MGSVANVGKAIRGAFVKGRYTRAGKATKKAIGAGFRKGFLEKHPKRRN